MAYEFITYRVQDRIAYVTINRPEVMNAMHAEANAEMRDAFTSFRDDDDAWIAILTGAGDRAFSAGNDLRATAERTARGERRVAGAGIPFGGITSGFE
jgi:enoyl-CoA hydratase/carnithine racemase